MYPSVHLHVKSLKLFDGGVYLGKCGVSSPYQKKC